MNFLFTFFPQKEQRLSLLKKFLADKKQKDRRHVVVTEATTEEEPLNNNVAEAKIPQEHDHLMSSHSGLKSEKCTI